MKLNFHTQSTNRMQFMSNAINLNLSKKTDSAKGKEENKDRLQLNPFQRSASRMEQLMSQKQYLTDKKNELITSTIEKGSTMDMIKPLLDSYDEQITNVETQMAQTMQESIEAMNETEENKDTPKTKEELQQKQLTSITNSAMDAKQIDVMESVKTKMTGEAKTLAMEIELDNSRGGAAPEKPERLGKLLARIDELSTDIMSKTGEKVSSLDDTRKEASKSGSLPTEEELAEQKADSDKKAEAETGLEG